MFQILFPWQWHILSKISLSNKSSNFFSCWQKSLSTENLASQGYLRNCEFTISDSMSIHALRNQNPQNYWKEPIDSGTLIQKVSETTDIHKKDNHILCWKKLSKSVPKSITFYLRCSLFAGNTFLPPSSFKSKCYTSKWTNIFLDMRNAVFPVR